MIYYKTDEEIEIIRENCLLVCEVLTYVGSVLKPGVSGLKLIKKRRKLFEITMLFPALRDIGDFLPPYVFP